MNYMASSSSTVSPPLPAASSRLAVNMSPCAACKTLRRRCTEECVLAPYFPPTDPLKFATVHQVFGASNIVKLLKKVCEAERADAVRSMVYEANARLRDPIYGCTGVICYLQKNIDELQVELARTQAEFFNMQCQNSNLLDQFYIQMATQDVMENAPLHHQNYTTFVDEVMGSSSGHDE